MSDFDKLVRKAWAEWDRARDEAPEDGSEFVPRESAPVLWFGDVDAYRKSSKKIVTIGVNPGPQTFPEDNPWAAYPGLKDGGRDPKAYVKEMNSFVFDKWFSDGWNNVLQPLGAAYPTALDSPLENYPLHLDLSPLMTRPILSEVRDKAPDFEQQLIKRGVGLLVDLLKVLKPGVSFVSVKTGHIAELKSRSGAVTVVAGEQHKPGGKIPHVVQQLEGGWPGKCFWFKRTGQGTISCGHDLQRAVGTWAAEGAEPDWQNVPVASFARKTAKELVEILREALQDIGGPSWKGGADKWLFARRIPVISPCGAEAHLSDQGTPAAIEQFVDLWDADETVKTTWGRKPSRAYDHVRLGQSGTHIAGLYLRWDSKVS